MIRKIIHIDEEKCIGCGNCAEACHEGAIRMVNGKAKLMRDDYCDGLGDCLPTCPTGAITFVEREAAAYDESAVLKNKQKECSGAHHHHEGSCPGHKTQSFDRSKTGSAPTAKPNTVSELAQWPCQIRLAPTRAPYFDNCHLLIAADCTAFAYANFHQDFMAGCVTLVGCPKLDPVDYSEKLTAIISSNSIRAITLARMEVPCCGGLEMALRSALAASGKAIPLSVTVMGIKGDIQAIR